MLFEATEMVLAPGVYRAKLTKIELAERANFETGEPEACRDWTFAILEEGHEGTSLRGRTSMSFGPSSKARAWVEGLLGRRVEKGEGLELEDVAGRECDLSISHRETDRGTFANIVSVNPVRKKSRKNELAEVEAMKNGRNGKATAAVAEAEEDLDSIPF